MEAVYLSSRIGGSWHLPTDGEWVMAFRTLKRIDASVNIGALKSWSLNDCSNRYVGIVTHMLADLWSKDVKLTDLMLLASEVVEWVELPLGRFGARGSTKSSGRAFIAHPLDPEPVRPLGDLIRGERLAKFGYRAIEVEYAPVQEL